MKMFPPMLLPFIFLSPTRASGVIIGPCTNGDQKQARIENVSGMKFYQAGQLDRALNEFKSAAEHDCAYFIARTNLASVLARLHRHEHAVEVLENAYTLDPEKTLTKIHADSDYKELIGTSVFLQSKLGKAYASMPIGSHQDTTTIVGNVREMLSQEELSYPGLDKTIEALDEPVAQTL